MITTPNRVVAAVNRGVPHIENSHGRVPGRRRLFLAADESVTRPAELMELALTRYTIQSANAGLLCVHFQSSSEHHDGGQCESVHHGDLLEGGLIDLHRQ